jgi:hypothetical protein
MSANEGLAALARNWKPPVELSGAGPREVRLSAGGKAVTCLAVLIFGGAVAAGVGLSRVAARQQTERATLRAAGAEIEGMVTRRWRDGDKSETPRVAYEFQYGGHTYHGSSGAPRRTWDSLAVGSPLTVRFVPANPKLNHPAEWETDVLPKFLPGVISAILVLLGGLIVFAIRRESRLLSEGRPAPARVTKVTRVKNGHMLRYEFRTLNGEVVKGRGHSRRAQPVGVTLCVVYDRDNARRNEPYPFNLVRVDR